MRRRSNSDPTKDVSKSDGGLQAARNRREEPLSEDESFNSPQTRRLSHISEVSHINAGNDGQSFAERRQKRYRRTVLPMDILDIPNLRHPRLILSVSLAARRFIGGASIKGDVEVTIDGGDPNKVNKKLPPLQLCHLTVDLVGYESCGPERKIFTTLSCDVFTEENPPPEVMTGPSPPELEDSWSTTPSTSKVPFNLQLPLDVGPPPYKKDEDEIAYVLCLTATVDEGRGLSHARISKEVKVYCIHEPEWFFRAKGQSLRALRKPLKVENSLLLEKGKKDSAITLGASLLRDTWVGGEPLYAAVRVDNHTPKTIKSMDITLEKQISLSPSAALSTDDDTYARDSEVICQKDSKSLNPSQKGNWAGIEPMSKEQFSVDLDIPPDAVTIRRGRLFGVSFFFCVTLTFRAGLFTKKLSVRAPVRIIHPLSKTALPDQLHQVVRSIIRSSKPASALAMRRKKRRKAAGMMAQIKAGTSSEEEEVDPSSPDKSKASIVENLKNFN